MDEKVFVLLVLLKEMRSPAEPDILSFFRFWCKLGGLGGESKTWLSNPRGLANSRTFHQQGGAVISVEGLWMINLTAVGFGHIGIDASPGIGCFEQSLPAHLKYEISSDVGTPDEGTRFLYTRFELRFGFLTGAFCYKLCDLMKLGNDLY